LSTLALIDKKIAMRIQCFAGIIALMSLVSVPALGQSPGFNRFTEDLTQALESDAASVLTRGMFVDFAKKLCSRLNSPASAEMEREVSAWSARNEPYIRASTAALTEIGNRAIPEGGEELRQAYFQMIMRESAKRVTDGTRRVFNGATLDNTILPLPDQCTTEAGRLRSGAVDIRNSPNMTRALSKFMESRGIEQR
jgi:hypothetical protein